MCDEENDAEKGCKLKWTPELIKRMLALRAQYSDLFTGKRGTAEKGWTKVAKKMGYERDWKVVQKKWFNMTIKYKAIKTPPSGISTEDGSIGAISWPYFNDMDSILGDRHIMNPPILVDSSFAFSASSSATHSSSTSSSISSISAASSRPPSCDSIANDYSEYIFIDELSGPSTSNSAVPKFSLQQSKYLPSPIQIPPIIPKSASQNISDAETPKKKKKNETVDDPYLSFLLEERRLAAVERQEERERLAIETKAREKERESKENFQKAMLDMMSKYFSGNNK